MTRRSAAKRWTAALLPWLLLGVGVWLVATQVSRPAFLIKAGDVQARVGCLALVMTAIIVSGGIDLSVGSTLALASVAMATVWQAGWPPQLAALAGVLTGLAAGAGNGLLVRGGLSPLVATLATMAFYRGLASALAGGRAITGLEPSRAILDGTTLGLPDEYWLLLTLAPLMMLVLHGTPFGRRCFAIGDSPLAARYAAVPVHWTRFWLYAASGLVAGVLAVIYTVRKGANPQEHAGLELEAIACVVVGGTLISGGRGGIPRTLLGIAVVASLDTGLQLLSSSVRFFTAEARLMVIGGLLILIAIGNQWLAESEE